MLKEGSGVALDMRKVGQGRLDNLSFKPEGARRILGGVLADLVKDDGITHMTCNGNTLVVVSQGPKGKGDVLSVYELVNFKMAV